MHSWNRSVSEAVLPETRVSTMSSLEDCISELVAVLACRFPEMLPILGELEF